MKINRTNLYSVLILFLGPVSLLALLYLIDISGSMLTEKQHFIFIVIIWVFILAYLTYEMVRDIIKIRYSSGKYIIITEIIGIIALAAIWFTNSVRFIDFDDSTAKQYYLIAANVTFAATLVIRKFLKMEKYQKNKEMV